MYVPDYMVSSLRPLNKSSPLWAPQIQYQKLFRTETLMERSRCKNWIIPEHYIIFDIVFNRLTPNDPHMGRTAPLSSKRCILYFYSTNIGTEHLKHALYSPFFSLQNAACFIMLTCLVPVLFTVYIQNVLKLKK